MAQKTANNPTVVLIPGLWHSPVLYEGLTARFIAAGYPVSSDALPSLNSQLPENQSIGNDAHFFRETLLLPLLSQGKDVLLVMHSYGGCPGSAAARGLSKHDF